MALCRGLPRRIRKRGALEPRIYQVGEKSPNRRQRQLVSDTRVVTKAFSKTASPRLRSRCAPAYKSVLSLWKLFIPFCHHGSMPRVPEEVGAVGHHRPHGRHTVRSDRQSLRACDCGIFRVAPHTRAFSVDEVLVKNCRPGGCQSVNLSEAGYGRVRQ